MEDPGSLGSRAGVPVCGRMPRSGTKRCATRRRPSERLLRVAESRFRGRQAPERKKDVWNGVRSRDEEDYPSARYLKDRFTRAR